MATDLITLAEVKAYQGVTGGNTNMDAELNVIIPKVSTLVKTYIGRSILDYFATNKEEQFYGVSQALFLKEAPIVSVQSVERSLDYGKTFVVLDEFVDYAIDRESDAIVIIGADRYSKSSMVTKVTYTGGYASTPEDLKLAVFDLVTFYQKAEMAVKSSRAAGANNAQIEYITNTTLPAHIRRVLDLFRLDL